MLKALKVILILMLIGFVSLTIIGVCYLSKQVEDLNERQVVYSKTNAYLLERIDLLSDTTDIILRIIELIDTKKSSVDIEQNVALFNLSKDAFRPNYDYLKSVSVILLADSLEWDENTEKPVLQGWMGSGTIVKYDGNYTYILTNQHVAPKQPNVSVFVWNDENKVKVPVEVLKNGITFDLSLVKVKGQLPNKKVIPGIGDVKIQDKIFNVGHHLGRPYIYGEGVFSGWEEEKEQGTKYMVTQIPCLFGCSGSGIFNQKGELVAVVFAGSLEIFGGIFPIMDVAHGLCVNTDTVREFLKEIM